MIPYSEREICKKFNQAIPVSNKEWRNGGLDFYFEVVDPMIVEEQAIEYPDFWGNVWSKRNVPLQGYEQQHLSELRPLKQGITKTI